MEKVCAWCRKVMTGGTDSVQQEWPVSHGICSKCEDNVRFQMGVKLREYLNSIDMPVLAVDSQFQVKVANDRAYRILQSPAEDVLDHPGGEVFECAHARLPEGCGRTVHCSGCAIRRAVTETYATGRPQVRVPATLQADTSGAGGSREIEITTEKAGDVVFLRIDRLERKPGSE